jgi:hypothetical protein
MIHKPAPEVSGKVLGMVKFLSYILDLTHVHFLRDFVCIQEDFGLILFLPQFSIEKAWSK